MNQLSQVHPSAQRSDPFLAWIFRQRGILANLPLIFALFWTGGETYNVRRAWTLGLALVLLGFAVRVWAQSHIHHRLTPLHRPDRMKFTGTGPYSMMRNPLYIGNTLIIVGATACSKLLWLMPISLVWCALVYSLTVRHEESVLPGLYGQPYLEFLAAVPRWLPRRASLREPGFFNEYTAKAMLAELHCFLVVLPFFFKDVFLSWAWHPFWTRLTGHF